VTCVKVNVVSEMKLLERGNVAQERGNGSVQEVADEEEASELAELAEARRNLAGEVVGGEVEGFEGG